MLERERGRERGEERVEEEKKKGWREGKGGGGSPMLALADSVSWLSGPSVSLKSDMT